RVSPVVTCCKGVCAPVAPVNRYSGSAAGGLATPDTGKAMLSMRSTPAALPTTCGVNVTGKLRESPAPIVVGRDGSLDTAKMGVSVGFTGGAPAPWFWLTLMLLTVPGAVPLFVIWNVRVEVWPTPTGVKTTLLLFCPVVVTLPAINE